MWALVIVPRQERQLRLSVLVNFPNRPSQIDREGGRLCGPRDLSNEVSPEDGGSFRTVQTPGTLWFERN